MTNLTTLVLELTFWRVDAWINIDMLRPALDAAQIPENARGALFAEACQKGYLIPTQTVIKTTHKPGKGRLIRVYKVTAKARREAMASA